MDKRISDILEHWFINEPLLFSVACLHRIEENPDMDCPVRCGSGRIEYNPALISSLPDRELDELLKAEAIRILLKHPYERRMEDCSQLAMGIGSNLVIGDSYIFLEYDMPRPEQWGLVRRQAYEWYSRRIQEMLVCSEDGAGGDGAGGDGDFLDHGMRGTTSGDLTALWGEDDLMQIKLNNCIKSCESWGSIPGMLAAMIKASTQVTIDWRKVLMGFRASILSSDRHLTRMRPNRRTGYENMGRISEFRTRLLIAIDVSGSVTDQSVSDFLSVVNSSFRYGFKTVDVLQFDFVIHSVQNMRRPSDVLKITGRGGTDLQPVVNYAVENRYDGLLFLTDGYAEVPAVPAGVRACPMAFVFTNKKSFKDNSAKFEELGRVCMMRLNNDNI